jgi:hypothetical protein
LVLRPPLSLLAIPASPRSTEHRPDTTFSQSQPNDVDVHDSPCACKRYRRCLAPAVTLQSIGSHQAELVGSPLSIEASFEASMLPLDMMHTTLPGTASATVAIARTRDAESCLTATGRSAFSRSRLQMRTSSTDRMAHIASTWLAACEPDPRIATTGGPGRICRGGGGRGSNAGELGGVHDCQQHTVRDVEQHHCPLVRVDSLSSLQGKPRSS